ncbi:SH3 domain-containing protein [Aquibium sp. A9E412]|uniref:SH3 domain-containing protein n=1 Tax=Aquibium sp. A9E412 TaxID=2976767 RepID=UPI0025AFA902|nr:SH3 domain-containing protein [Aquibium sp. A9E412]MDN2564824.1 SH3 domain-containing protein [Aquibium sp. A9E412]
MGKLRTAAVAAGLLVPGVATAATSAIVTTDLNIRSGPSTSYARFGTIPDGDRVTVYGCVRDYNWCEVRWAGRQGWVSGNYLAYLGERYNRRPLPQIGFSIGLPIISFEGERVYRERPRRGYRDGPRGGYREAPREVRRELRRDRRDVRDAREDLREARRDLRRAQRRGEDVRGERRDLRQARRELRRERRDLRRTREEFRDWRG